MFKIGLDYGHGGTDPGAVKGNLKEKDMNYHTGKACKEELEKHNVIVYESRTKDQTLSLEQRSKIFNATDLNYVVSIHHNAGNGDRGEVIHSISNSGKPLSEKIGVELKSIGQSVVKVYSRKADNSNTDYYGMIRLPKATSVIVEVCFIDNATDVQIADTIEEQRRNGRAIAHGILKQLGVHIKPQDTPGTLYQVVAGTYSVKANAEAMEAKLKAQGIGAFIQLKK